MGFRVAALRGARWILWILLAWVFIRGIFSILLPPPRAEAPAAAPAAPAADHSEAPGALGALFAREYLTWKAGQEAQRAERLRGLLAPHLDGQAGWSAGGTLADQTAEGTWPFHVRQMADGKWLVTVAARVTTHTAAGPAPRLLYLAVPVAAGPGGYQVYDFPTFVPAPAAAGTAVAPDLAGQDVSDEGGQVRALLTGFFKAYAAGGSADVTYFLEPGSKAGGLQGALEFKAVDELTLRVVEGQTWASAVVSMVDPLSGAAARQRYTLQVVQRDGRWYVKQLMQKGV